MQLPATFGHIKYKQQTFTLRDCVLFYRRRSVFCDKVYTMSNFSSTSSITPLGHAFKVPFFFSSPGVDNQWASVKWDVSRVDVGVAGVWALDNDGQVYLRLGTHGDNGSQGKPISTESIRSNLTSTNGYFDDYAVLWSFS